MRDVPPNQSIFSRRFRELSGCAEKPSSLPSAGGGPRPAEMPRRLAAQVSSLIPSSQHYRCRCSIGQLQGGPRSDSLKVFLVVCSELFEARLPGWSQLRGFRAQDGGPASAVGVFVDRLMFAVLRGSKGARLGSKLGK